MKKTAAILISFAIAVLVSAGCSEKGDSYKTESIDGITIKTYNSSIDPKTYENDYNKMSPQNGSTKAFIVRTDSMSPTFKTGDVVISDTSVDASQILVDDIIVINPSKGSDAYLIHRVNEKFQAKDGTICFKTKEDMNDTSDSFVIDEGRLVGKVFEIIHTNFKK